MLDKLLRHLLVFTRGLIVFFLKRTDVIADVIEATKQGGIRNRIPLTQTGGGSLQAQIPQVMDRRKAGALLEQTDKMRLAQVCFLGQTVNGDLFRIMLFHVSNSSFNGIKLAGQRGFFQHMATVNMKQEKEQVTLDFEFFAEKIAPIDFNNI